MALDIIHEIEQRRKKEKKRKSNFREAVRGEITRKIKNSDNDRLLFEKFKRIIKGEQFVKLEHIDALGLEYDVLFFTTIKSTGKTRNIIFNRFHHYAMLGKKIIYVRASVTEIDKHRAEFNDSPYNPLKIVNSQFGYKLIHKQTGVEHGICIDMKNANSISGGEFADYAAIIFDEALPWTSNNTINDAHISNFFVLPSSVQRNKKEKIKVFLISNIPSTKKNLHLLDHLGIDLDQDLTYIKRENINNPNVSCKILYINAGSLYPGINSQDGAAQMADQSAKLMLGSNKIVSSYDNTIGDSLFDFLKSKYALIFTHRHVDYLLWLKYAEDHHKNKTIHCLAGRVFDPSTYVDSIIFTDSKLTNSMYGDIVKYIPSTNWYKCQIMYLMKQNKLIFANDKSVEIARLIYDIFERDNPILF